MKYTSLYKKKSVELGNEIASGGEGSVYDVQGNDAVVAKIYNSHSRTSEREKKLRVIIEKKLPFKEVYNKKIALPLDILYDENGAFAGYVMPKINGKPIKTTIFSKKRIEKSFPNLSRIDLVDICISFLEQIKYLHSKNMLIGDINPNNMLIDTTDPTKTWLIDCDSFQVDDLPCPVGTDAFTPPNLQGKNFKNTLRNKEDEYFSMAIMLFMILMPGKHPYSQIDGSSPDQNIKTMNFPYPFEQGEKMDNVPKGYWGVIWTHFTRRLRETFYETFKLNKRFPPHHWIDVLKKYRYSIEQGYYTNDIYPAYYKPLGKDIVTQECAGCGITIEISKRYLDFLLNEGKQPLCALCKVRYIDAMALSKKARQKSSKTRISNAASHTQSLANNQNYARVQAPQYNSSASQPHNMQKRTAGAPIRFNPPSEVIATKKDHVNGYDTILRTGRRIHIHSRDSINDIYDALKSIASSVGANALINVQYDSYTGSEGNYFYTIHHISGEFAVIGKVRINGACSTDDLPDIQKNIELIEEYLKKEKEKPFRKAVLISTVLTGGATWFIGDKIDYHFNGTLIFGLAIGYLVLIFFLYLFYNNKDHDAYITS